MNNKQLESGGFNQVNQETMIDFGRYWETIAKRKWKILFFALFMAALVAAIVMSITPMYRATATLLIESQEAKVVSIEEVYGFGGQSKEYFQTEFEILKSRSLIEKVVRKLNLVKPPEFHQEQQSLVWYKDILPESLGLKLFLPVEKSEFIVGTAKNIESEDVVFNAVVKHFMTRLSISPVRKTQIVRISFDAEDPQLAKDVANAMANGYIDNHLDAKMELTSKVTRWMVERLGGLSVKLKEAEERLQNFREQENLVDIQGGTLSESELKELASRLLVAQQEFNRAQSLRQQVISINDGENIDGYESISAVLQNPLVRDLSIERARAGARISELSKRYGSKHPKMIAAHSEFNSTDESLRKQVKRVVDGVINDYYVALANVNDLTSALVEAKTESHSISRKQYRLRELAREVLTTQELYDTFLKRIKETSATSSLKTANARVVDPAIKPTIPVKPKKALLIMLAFAVSVVFGVVVAFFLDALNNTFQRVEDVEAILNLRVLGIVPTIKKIKKRKLEMSRLFFDKDNSGFSEAIRTIRTGLVLSGVNKPHKVIMVTSSVPGEGKTTFSSNLAFALGKVEKVIYIDADMRRPCVAKNFGFQAGQPGVANVISGTAGVSECTHRVDGIDIILAGIVPPNPQELLSSKRFGTLLSRLAEKYDRVIIDSPPVNAVSDPLLLSVNADAVIYVTRAGATKREQVKAGVGRLLQANASILGLVLNFVDISKQRGKTRGYDGYFDQYDYSMSDRDA